jgi:hypothetical protein
MNYVSELWIVNHLLICSGFAGSCVAWWVWGNGYDIYVEFYVSLCPCDENLALESSVNYVYNSLWDLRVINHPNLLSEVQDSGVRIYVVWPMQGGGGGRGNDPSYFTYLDANSVLKMEWNGWWPGNGCNPYFLILESCSDSAGKILFG